MHKRWWIIIAVAVLLVAVIGATNRRRTSVATNSKAKAGSGQAGRMGPNLAVPVVATPASTQDFPIYLRGLGSVTAYNTVTVRSRVDGQLIEVNFREGQEVRKGDLLAVIDPRPFQVQLDQAQANLAKDQAQLNDAKVNLERFNTLFADKIIAQQQVDTQRALVGQLQGALGADQAAIENAKLQLVYCHIHSPIDGRVGLRLVDPGNIVHASDANGMLVITQLHPIAVLFTLPEDYVASVLTQMQRGPLEVEAYSRDDTTRIATGRLLTLNNEIDPTTGTDRLKAVFDNRNRMLWPNQFVNVHLLLQIQKNALIIPTAGVQHGSQGTFVYVVKPDKTVEVRNIKVGVTEGNLVSIQAGVKPGELVVTDGQDKLQPGSKVEVRPGGASGTQQQTSAGS